MFKDDFIRLRRLCGVRTACEWAKRQGVPMWLAQAWVRESAGAGVRAA